MSKGFIALFFLLGFMRDAPATMIYYEELQPIVTRSNLIGVGKIVTTGKKESQVSIEYTFTVRLTQPIFGNMPAQEIQAHYTFFRPMIRIRRNDHGKTWQESESPLETGSGLEEEANAGEKYIFFFAKNDPGADGYRLLRIEPIEKSGEVKKWLVEPETTAFRAKVNSITAMAVIKTRKKALAVDIDPRWMVNVQVKSVAGDCDMLSENAETDFAIHSPARMFLEDREKVIGTSRAFELTRTRIPPATTRYNLKAFPWLLQDDDIAIYDIRIADWGTYRKRIGEKKHIATITSGVAHVMYDKELMHQTDRIVARKGLSFGFRYWLKCFPRTASPLMKILVQHPPIKNPRTGKAQTESFWEDPAYIGALNYHTSWLFSEDCELVPGKWVIALYYKEKKLLEKEFLVNLN